MILLKESLYYVAERSVIPLLERYSRWLASNGVFLVRVYDREIFGPLLKQLCTRFREVERAVPMQGPDGPQASGNGGAIVLVLRPDG